jgi:hypothetical protein
VFDSCIHPLIVTRFIVMIDRMLMAIVGDNVMINSKRNTAAATVAMLTVMTKNYNTSQDEYSLVIVASAVQRPAL